MLNTFQIKNCSISRFSFIFLFLVYLTPVYALTGYLREAEESFCMDECSIYYLEDEYGEFITWVAQLDNLEMLEPYAHRFVDIEGDEIECVECTAINVSSISMSDACEFPVECFADPCTVEDCSLYPDAECIANYCDGCWADFYMNEELMDCHLDLECVDLTGIDFGPCDMELGIAWSDNYCHVLSGCGWVVDGVDYSDAFFNSIEECQAVCPEESTTWHVSDAGSDETGDGSAENPFATIQNGIDVATDGDTVLVQPGTYYGPIDFLSKNLVLGSLYLLEENESYIDGTIILNTDNDVSNFVNISSVQESELNGFTFQYIHLNLWDASQAIIHVKDASPAIINNRFKDFYLFSNMESSVIYCENSSSLIMNNEFMNGSVGNGYVLGGYILSKGSSLTIKNNRMENGYVGFADPSGYIVSVNSNDLIESNTILNASMGYCFTCAAIAMLDGSNCIIRNNLIFQAYGDGYGAVVASESQFVSYNNTLVSNGMGYANLFSDGIVSNDIIHGSNNTVYLDESSTMQVSYSDIQGGWEGEGNIDEDPLFVAPNNDDFSLQEGSPCIDAGDPNSPIDPDGTIADMGAYYFHQEGGDPTELIVNYQSDWNLVGLPLNVEDASYTTLFPESIEGTLYSFDDGYNPETSLIQGDGYWLRFNGVGSTTIIGSIINELTISMSEGWNLISGISTPLNISDIQDPGVIIISGTVYGFTSTGYTYTEIIEPGKGYWVRASGPGEITINQ